MDESHLEARADASEGTCSIVCDKIMKHMVLTLTILGKCSCHRRGAFTYNPPVIFLLILASAVGGVYSVPACVCKRKQATFPMKPLQKSGQTHSHLCTINHNCMFFWEMENGSNGNNGVKSLFSSEENKCYSSQTGSYQSIAHSI